MAEKAVYLPAGHWYYFFNDQLYTGANTVTIKTPLDEMPLFVKAGAVLPEYPAMQYTQQTPVTEMLLHVYFGEEEVKSVLYEDAGDHYGYKNGQYNVIRFKQHSTAQKFYLRKQFFVNYETAYKNHRVTIHGLPFKPTTLLVDGQTVALTAANMLTDNTVSIVVPRNFEEIVMQ